MKVLVTGGAGFIGSHLVDALISRGDEVQVVDSFEPFYPEAMKRRNIEEAIKAGAVLRQVDIRNARALYKEMREFRPEIVVHLAARPGVRPSLAQPALYAQLNVGGTVNVLEAARRAKVHRIVYASSSSVYGLNKKAPFSESDPVAKPASPYAATKAAGELLCHSYSHLYGMQTTVLRFFTVYGPRQRPEMAIHKFARLLLDGQPLRIYAKETSRDYTYVSDIVAGVLGAMAFPKPYVVYNLGNSDPVGLANLVDLVATAVGVVPHLRLEGAQPGDVPSTWADITRAQREIGYSPEVGLPEGVARFVEWLRTQPTSP